MILGLMLTVILLPFAGGGLLQLIKFKEKRSKQCFIFAYAIRCLPISCWRRDLRILSGLSILPVQSLKKADFSL